MASRQAHFSLPDDLLKEIDQLVGQSGRGAFLCDLVKREVSIHGVVGAAKSARMESSRASRAQRRSCRMGFANAARRRADRLGNPIPVMPAYLLDTSVIIDLINGRNDRRNFIKSLLRPERELSFSGRRNHRQRCAVPQSCASHRQSKALSDA